LVEASKMRSIGRGCGSRKINGREVGFIVGS
jgi:hypothetical protein